MTLTYILMQNLRRNPLRSALTMVSFALPMAIFVAAISLVVALNQVSADNETQLRLAVRNKVTLINLQPEGMRRKIEALDPDHERITAVCGMRWFGGKVPNAKNIVQSLGADADTFPFVFADIAMTPAEIELWNRERRAAVVGSAVAEQYSWKTGDRVTLESSIPPYLPLEFLLVKIVNKAGRTNALYFRRDYLEESLRTVGFANPSCNVFWLRCTSAAAMRSVQNDVDQLFANSPNETRTEDENAFAAGFVQAMGDLPGLMRSMAIVVVIIIALVAGNTMMMSFRERIRELAVFKAIGFQGARIFFIVMAESLALATIGALLGILPTVAYLAFFPPRQMGYLPISALVVSPIAIAVSFAIALLVGLVAGLWPAYQAMRLGTVDALRQVA